MCRQALAAPGRLRQPGNAPIFLPPAAHYHPPEDFGYMVERATYTIDLPRLLAQWGALACLTAGP